MRRNILCIILCMILLSACSSKSNEIIEGYSNCEEYYSDGFQDYIDYCKYFYKESEDKKFEENSYYSIVTKENIDDIKSYFDKFPYESMEDSNKYDDRRAAVPSDFLLSFLGNAGEEILPGSDRSDFTGTDTNGGNSEKY